MRSAMLAAGRRVVSWFRSRIVLTQTQIANWDQGAERHWLDEQMRMYAGFVNRRTTPLMDGLTGETAEMRLAYRSSVAEPTVKSALIGKIGNVARLQLQVIPEDKDNPREVEAAEFVHSSILGPSGTIWDIVWPILSGGLVDGFSVAEKLYEPIERGRWKGKWGLKKLKSKDTQYIQFEVDPFRNVQGLFSTYANYSATFDPNDFIHFSYLPFFESPTGMSDVRSSYRAVQMIVDAVRLRMIMLSKFSGPFIKATYKDGTQRAELAKVLAEARGRGFIIAPQSTEVEVLDLAARGTEDFQRAIDDLRKEVAIGISGAFLHMLEGMNPGARGDSEVQQDTVDTFVWMLGVALCTTLNEQLVSDLILPNYGPSIAFPRISLPSESPEQILKALAIDQTLLQMGLPLSKSEIYSRTGRRPPSDPKDQLSQQPPPQQGGMGGPPAMGGPGGQPSPLPSPAPQVGGDGFRPTRSGRGEYNPVTREWRPRGGGDASPDKQQGEPQGDDAIVGDSPQNHVETIAEIMYGTFGDQAIPALRNDLRKFAEWKANLHPRGKDGRFIPKGSPEAIAAASEAIGKVLRGERSPDNAKSVLEHLGTLTVKQLKDLHRQHGKPIPGKLRADIEQAVRDRLTNGTNQPQGAQPNAPNAEPGRTDTGGSGPNVGQPSPVSGGVAKETSESSDAKARGVGKGSGLAAHPATHRGDRKPEDVGRLDRVRQKLERYKAFFRAKGHHQIAEWLDLLDEHIDELGIDNAINALGVPLTGGVSGKVQYKGADPLTDGSADSDFVRAYLDRHGITMTPDASLPTISSIPSESGKAGDVIPTYTPLENKLQESKLLPGLESSEDIGVIHGSPVTNLTPDVLAKLDEKYGKGKWVIKPYGDTAYASFGILFPQRVEALQNDAKSSMWDTKKKLGKHGYDIARDDSGKAIGIKNTKSGEVHPFGSQSLAATPKKVQELARVAKVAAVHEGGVRLSGTAEEQVETDYGITVHRDVTGKVTHVTDEAGKEHPIDSPGFKALQEYIGEGGVDALARAMEGGVDQGDMRFMVQPAFESVGVTEEDRAMGYTWETNKEGRVHVMIKNGKASVIPYATLAGREDSIPVVFHNDETRAMEKAAQDAIDALPEDMRTGQIYAPDMMKTKDGWKAIELNASVEGGSSGWLEHNPMVMDAYVSHVLGRDPAHVEFIRKLVRDKRKGPLPSPSQPTATPPIKPSPSQPTATPPIKGGGGSKIKQ